VMNKAKSIAWAFVGLILGYSVLALFIGFLADRVVATNQTLDASTNMTQYPGASSFLLAIPWLMYFMPGILFIVVVIQILKWKPEVARDLLTRWR